MLGVTCDNASANERMVENLAKLVVDFPRDANHARCLAHVVNLVVKIILCQFDISKKKKNSDVPKDNPKKEGSSDDEEKEMSERDVDELVRGLDKEEKEMDDGDDDEESDKVLRDVKELEGVLEEELEEVVKLAKPVRQILYKVSLGSIFFFYS